MSTDAAKKITLKIVERRIEQLEAEILMAVGEAGTGLMPDGNRFMRIQKHRKGYGPIMVAPASWIEPRLKKPITLFEEEQLKRQYNELIKSKEKENE